MGSILGEGTDFGAVLNLTFQPGCVVSNICGRTATQWCSVDLDLTAINGDTFVFTEQNPSDPSCPVGGIDHIRLQTNGTLLFRYERDPSQVGSPASGVLHRP